ncbi:MAG: hypothetical protein SF066_11025 [Thermoanaerobaculia bacterium]|nr:hypothetical protein [Thermoanaerobaculia bacterium]
MKWSVIVLLVLAAAFVGSSVVDACPDSEGGDCPPACHLACIDGCTVVPLEISLPALMPLGPTPERHLETAFALLDLDFPPETFPPKA